jgi:hypothetical protein
MNALKELICEYSEAHYTHNRDYLKVDFTRSLL